MKKVLKIILSIILFLFVVKIEAYELTYSEWSEEYPSEYDEMFIESEDRYLWYKEEIIKEEYLIKEEIGDRKVDYNDFKYSDESEESLIKPEEKEDRIINEYTSTYTDNDICGFTIEKKDIKGSLVISEIEFLKLDDLSHFSIINKEEYSYLFNSNYEDKNEFDFIKIKLKNNININDILLKIYYFSDNNKNTIKFNYIACDDYPLYEGTYEMDIKRIQVLKDDLEEKSKTVTRYTYKDKLYKTYIIKKDITDEYYKELDGYTKIEDSKKTFYRYITNEYVLTGLGGIILKNDSFCRKNFCKIVYVTKKEKVEEEEEIVVNNPQTIDNIYYYIVIFLVSVLVLLIIARRKIYLVLSKRFKKK